MSSIFCFLLESSRIPRCQMCTEFVFFGLLITNVLPDQIQSAHGFLNSRGPGCFVRRAVFARDALMSKITVCLIPIYIFSCLFFFCFLSYLSSFCTRETKDVFIMKLFSVLLLHHAVDVTLPTTISHWLTDHVIG